MLLSCCRIISGGVVPAEVHTGLVVAADRRESNLLPLLGVDTAIGGVLMLLQPERGKSSVCLIFDLSVQLFGGIGGAVGTPD
jgi:hypothetical protein